MENNIDERFYFTHKQMIYMMSATRTWTLNNPSGGLPHLPVFWTNVLTNDDNLKLFYETRPEIKKTHWLLNILMKYKIL